MMDEKAIVALNALAQKLGTTVDKIWQILDKQATTVVIYDMVAIFVTIGLLVGIVAALRKYYEKIYHHDEMYGVLAVVLSVAVGLVMVVTMMANVSEIFQIVANREFWMLKTLMSWL